MKTVAVVQARMTSSRLPGKVLHRLAGKPILAHVVERAGRIPGVDAVCVAAPTGPLQQPIVDLCAKLEDVSVVRGPEDDVLRRFALAADASGADVVVRITADCPLLDPAVAGAVVTLREACAAPIAATALESGYPTGYDVEALTARALRIADAEACDAYEREHVTPFLWRRPERFPMVSLDRAPDLRNWRLVVDEPDDFALVSRIFDALYADDPYFGFDAVEQLLRTHPELLPINAGVAQTRYQR